MAFGFKLFADLFKMMQSTWPPLKENMDADQAIRIEDLMDTAILPGVSIWCTFFFSNLPLMAQFCTVNANTEIRSGVRARESEKRQLIRVRFRLGVLDRKDPHFQWTGHASFPFDGYCPPHVP